MCLNTNSKLQRFKPPLHPTTWHLGYKVLVLRRENCYSHTLKLCGEFYNIGYNYAQHFGQVLHNHSRGYAPSYGPGFHVFRSLREALSWCRCDVISDLTTPTDYQKVIVPVLYRKITATGTQNGTVPCDVALEMMIPNPNQRIWPTIIKPRTKTLTKRAAKKPIKADAHPRAKRTATKAKAKRRV